MKNKIVLFFLTLSISTATTAILAETTNNAENIVTKDVAHNQIGSDAQKTNNNISLKSLKKLEINWKNAREALSAVKDIMISITGLYVILYIIEMNNNMIRISNALEYK